jgi:hypothetical protein
MMGKVREEAAIMDTSGTLNGIPGDQVCAAPGNEVTFVSCPPVINPLKIFAERLGGSVVGGVKGTGASRCSGVPIVSVLTTARRSV